MLALCLIFSIAFNDPLYSKLYWLNKWLPRCSPPGTSYEVVKFQNVVTYACENPIIPVLFSPNL